MRAPCLAPTRLTATHTARQVLAGCISHEARKVAAGVRLASTVADNAPKPTIDGKSSGRRERVVILGSGWAGYAFARKLDPQKYERIMVSPRSYFVFTPLVAGTAVGTLEFRAVVEPVRRLGLDEYHQAWADGVDFARKVVRVEANTSDDLTARTPPSPPSSPLSSQQQQQPPTTTTTTTAKGPMFDVPYDKLVVAVGAYAQTFGIEGVREHAHFLRDVGDARRIRTRVLRCFERASLPTTTEAGRCALLHFAVVGGGPTGIEFAAELHDLVRDDLRATYPSLAPLARITVYDVADKVLPMFDRRLAQYATDTFRRERIDVRTGHHLTRIRAAEDGEERDLGCLRLKFREHGDGDEVSAGLVVWSTGLMPNPLIGRLGAAETGDGGGSRGGGVRLRKDDKSGGLVTDAHLRVVVGDHHSGGGGGNDVLPDVFSIGDCTVVDGQRYPATAQVASQQAAYLARRLNKGDVGTADAAALPFRFRNWGVMTYLGSWRAIHQSSADELTGRAAWFLWRTAYLTKSMSVRNKIMVPVYWFMSWLFGRDISRF
ncbi:putative pyridine nucleotide-disulfide [Rosellinia necatrix]|uniref:Putative pyridine nucleotide-disulfide n=1 Tax=Rosellinia necatrix TaxID=77044 RepID=A0A1W2TEQ9_ROSNE|nr:putative pyridine nucleotide-disulfide [Rosellinia necatrix]